MEQYFGLADKYNAGVRDYVLCDKLVRYANDLYDHPNYVKLLRRIFPDLPENKESARKLFVRKLRIGCKLSFLYNTKILTKDVVSEIIRHTERFDYQSYMKGAKLSITGETKEDRDRGERIKNRNIMLLRTQLGLDEDILLLRREGHDVADSYFDNIIDAIISNYDLVKDDKCLIGMKDMEFNAENTSLVSRLDLSILRKQLDLLVPYKDLIFDLCSWLRRSPQNRNQRYGLFRNNETKN